MRFSSLRSQGLKGVSVGAWGLTDQAISSVTNVAVSIAVARSSSKAGFGAYSLAFAAYVLTMGIAINLANVPVMIRDGAGTREEQRRPQRALLSAGMAVAFLSSVIMIAGGLTQHGAQRSYFLLYACMMPFLILQANWRISYFATRQPRLAAMCDGIWLAVQAIGSFALLLAGIRSGIWFAATWGAGAGAAGIFFSWRESMWPRPRFVTSFLRHYRKLVPSLVGEYLASGGVNQLILYLLVIVVGLEGVAAIKAAQLELSALNIPLQGLGPLAMAFAVRAFARGTERLREFLRLCAVGGVLGILCVGLAMAFVPVDIMRHFVGPNALAAQPLVIPMAVMLAGQWFSVVAYMGLRARSDVRVTFVLQGLISAIFTAGALLAGHTWGPSGACWAMAAAYVLGGAGAWRFQQIRLRRCETAATERSIEPGVAMAPSPQDD